MRFFFLNYSHLKGLQYVFGFRKGDQVRFNLFWMSSPWVNLMHEKESHEWNSDTTNHCVNGYRKGGATILNECLEYECVSVETDEIDIYRNLLYILFLNITKLG